MSELWAAAEGHARDLDLVFEGGGLKGIVLVGAYSVSLKVTPTRWQV